MTELADSIKFLFSPLPVVVMAVLISSLCFATGGDSLLVASASSYSSPAQRRGCAVLVTGASRGIGNAIALHLSSLGYTVFGNVRSQSSFDELLTANTGTSSNNEQQTAATAGEIIPVKFDVTNDGEIRAAVATIETACEEKKLNLVAIVNNAAINPEGDVLSEYYLETDDAKKRIPDNVLADIGTVTKVMDTNLIGCFRVTRAFLPILMKERGRIILIGSYYGTIAGAIGLPHLAYESSKFALEGLADGLRRGLKKEGGVRVSLIKPGNIQTDMNAFGETSPAEVSRDVLTALEAKKPKARYYPGTVKGIPCKLLCRFFALFPSWVTDKQL